MFWSGADFQEPNLNIVGEKFKDASVFYNSESEIRIMIILNTLLKTGVCYGYRNGVLGDKKNFTYTFTPSSGTDTLSIGRLTQIRDSLSPYNGGHTYFEYYRVRTL